MYIINNLMYGHNLSENRELSELIWEYDVDFKREKNGVCYRVHRPYHGGQVADEIPSIMFGAEITDDDGNRDYIKQAREAKEETYQKDYQEFVQEFLTDLKANVGLDEDYADDEEDYSKFVEKMEKFLSENEPEIYSVESSS